MSLSISLKFDSAWKATRHLALFGGNIIGNHKPRFIGFRAYTLDLRVMQAYDLFQLPAST